MGATSAVRVREREGRSPGGVKGKRAKEAQKDGDPPNLHPKLCGPTKKGSSRTTWNCGRVS